MGVGVYSNDFEGAGTAFILSPTFFLTDEEYEEYKKTFDGSDEDDEPLDEEDWAMEVQEDFVEEARSVAASALAAVGWDAATDFGNRDRLGIDSDFMKMATAGDFEIGIRSWETDYIMVTALREGSLLCSLVTGEEEYEGQAMEEFGVDVKTLRDRTADRLSALEAIMILKFQELGEPFDCRYRTSGWTTSAYEKPENIETAIEEKIEAFNAAEISKVQPAPAI